MKSRRNFLKWSMMGGVAGSAHTLLAGKHSPEMQKRGEIMVISTWNHGMAANQEAWRHLQNHATALDAVVAGAGITEADPSVSSVGYGGFPDATGKVTLDACVMNEKGQCGSVAYLENIMHPSEVARLVMERTPHIMLAGDGALNFAKEQGFPEQDLLTDRARRAWQDWLENSGEIPSIADNHDTIGILAIDKNQNISGVCTTSGTAFKLRGRVGDSPLIGAGLFVDNDVGAAAATGVGEAVIRVSGSHLVVELMRQGHSPVSACKQAVRRIFEKVRDYDEIPQVGFIALNKSGGYGGFSVRRGFQYAIHNSEGGQLIDCPSRLPG